MSFFWNCLSCATFGGYVAAAFADDWRKALGCALLTVGFAIAGAEPEASDAIPGR